MRFIKFKTYHPLGDPGWAIWLRKLYFGVIMRASALFPTLFHFFLTCGSLFRAAITQPAAGGLK